MSTAQAALPHVADSAFRADRECRRRLTQAIDHAAHKLPTQGPITSFIHHNTLHAYEGLPFDRAVLEAARLFGCQPYLVEDKYREALDRGRIRETDLEAVLRDDLGSRADERLGPLGSRFEIRLAMLRHPPRTGPASELRWFVAETDALRRFQADLPATVRERMVSDTRHWVMRDLRAGDDDPGREATNDPDARKKLGGVFQRFDEAAIETWDEETWEAFTLRSLWRLCRDAVHEAYVPTTHPAHLRHRDALREMTGADIDLPVNDLLIRFCAAFLDQGIAAWPLPERELGFYDCFCQLYRREGSLPDGRLEGLSRELARLQDSRIGPDESILESLHLLGTREDEWEEYITATLLALRGWAGMTFQVESRGDRVARPVPAGSLKGFLAVRLVLERLALANQTRDTLGLEEPLHDLRTMARSQGPGHEWPNLEQRAFPVFQLAQTLGWTPQDLHRLSESEWSKLIQEVEGFSGLERRRVFQSAYERRFLVQTIDAVATRAARRLQTPNPPRFQMVCCLDEREESFRRHVEETVPDAETFGTAGFYALAMYYRGAAEARFMPLCPGMMTPAHWVEEHVVDRTNGDHRRRAKARRVLGAMSHRVHVGSRTFAGGALLSAGTGVLATAPLVARILFPRLAAGMRRRLGRYVEPPKTRLTLERVGPEPGPDSDELGYSLEEMTDIAETVLKDVGLTEQTFSRLVLVLGHGSHSMNNPHEAAHDCGACGGAVGGPNGRAFAQIANDRRIRERLADRGLSVPADTVFVGGLHNTCNEYVKFYDVDLVPESHRREFEEARKLIEQALGRDAHERARRFDSAPLSISFADARRHMDGRAEDLAQVRPEWGHATNAVTIVGRRSRTRGLFLDRRAFLTSYDPTQDDAEATILTRTMQAVVPVCAGIALEYYFSHVDPTGWGCGTKLPHNVAALLGVMDGAASDLRTGLPWQMVEIHEPLRQLFIVETTPEAMLRIIDDNEAIGRLCRNLWIYLAILDPESPTMQIFRDGAFRPYQPETSELPKAHSSVDWYRGWRENLDFAEIDA